MYLFFYYFQERLSLFSPVERKTCSFLSFNKINYLSIYINQTTIIMRLTISLKLENWNKKKKR